MRLVDTAAAETPRAPQSGTPDAQFTAEALSSRVTRVIDRLDVQMHLVEGEDRALLIDSGFGVGDLRGFVDTLLKREDVPLTVLLTHGHVDHAFGAGAFDDVLMNPADNAVFDTHADLARTVHEQARAEGAVVAPWPDRSAYRPVHPGDVIDLGGVRVEVYDGRGHTPGSLALLLVEERMLVTGDVANQFTFMFMPEATPLEDYRARLVSLEAELAGRYDRVLGSHGTGNLPITVLPDLVALCDRVLHGTDDAQPFTFEHFRGRVARAVDLDNIPDQANLVYDPARLRAPQEAPC